MTRKLRYLLYSGPRHEDIRLMVPGLFQWSQAFKKYGLTGDMSARIDGDMFREYDIVHVNYTPTNPSYISAIRNELGDDSDTKIIANVDFGTMMWNRMDPLVMRDQLNKADMVFHVETEGALRLQQLLKRDVHVIPHPVDTESIKKLCKSERTERITCQYHRYADTWAEYYYGLQLIREEYDMNVLLMSYLTPKPTEGIARVPIVCMFNEIKESMEYWQYIQFMASTMLNVDVTHDSTYGRGVVDMAALGVPTVGSRTIEAMQIIWPELAITPGKDGEMYNMVRYMLDNEDFREKMVRQGQSRCDGYSLENSYNHMADILEREELISC